MITFDGRELNESLVWTDRHQSYKVAQTRRVSLGGRQIITTAATMVGRPITLAASENFGWLSKDDVAFILSLAESAGSTYTLVFGSETFQVMFRHEEPPAVELVPLIARTTEEVTDYFVGQIKFITV